MNSYWKGRKRGPSHFKGKTYEKIYGIEKAIQLKEQRKLIKEKYATGEIKISKKQIKNLIKINKKRKNKTYKEIYGDKQALEEIEKRKHPGVSYRPIGYKHSDKTKRKISKAHKGKIISLITRKKLSLLNRGKPNLKLRGKTSPHKGKTFEEIMGSKRRANERIKNFSKKRKGHIVTEDTKYKIRLSAIEQQIRDRGEFKSNIGKNETKILDLLELKLGYPIIRQYPIYGYFVDGYCKKNNTVYEVDENKHFKNGKLIKRDKNRQKNIIKKLNCKFVRIKEKDFLNKLKDLV